ncbi:MAG: hypothetical protein J07HQW2_00048 [Haloquadratum walsbyi J07HQW2]|jgi:Uncharacterized conserved protein|uniref:Uncharacterized protein n=1 Tax=Haloquadratum walsbyi J07HQW2 TaxID=1238425 RepID=U1N9X0_9EURY|nr:MAG: hypothetical protein J07HQW2_00048 [Haloquadratum walsbyi J07HQW2]
MPPTELSGMCGRNSLFIDQADLEARFDAEVVTDGGYTPRYNIAPGDADRSRAYLAEKNRLLNERVGELEATLEQKTERIQALEAEIERLTDELTARDGETEQSHKEDSGTAGETGDGSEPASLLRRFFGGRSE